MKREELDRLSYSQIEQRRDAARIALQQARVPEIGQILEEAERKGIEAYRLADPARARCLAKMRHFEAEAKARGLV